MRSNIENDWLRQDQPSFYTPSPLSGRSSVSDMRLQRMAGLVTLRRGA
jgi:hypothetical protein